MTPLFGQALKATLMDEFEHEDEIVSGFTGRKINPERVRGIFLGFNDGLVEILGAVSGFFTALREPRLVLGASIAVAVAGALSMAAGAYAATSSEREMKQVQRGKALFLGRKKDEGNPSSPVSTGWVVGISYFVGTPPRPPRLFLGQTPWPPSWRGEWRRCWFLPFWLSSPEWMSVAGLP